MNPNDSLLAANPHPKFNFRCVTQQDVPIILEFAVKHFFNFLVPLGSSRTEEQDADWIEFFRNFILSDISNETGGLSIVAVDRTSGEIVGIRLNKEVKRGDPPGPAPILKSEKNKEIFVWFVRILDSVDVFTMYPEVDSFGDMLGIAVHTDYRKCGLATELYKRSFALMSSKGVRIGKVGFTNPYSRKAGNNLGFQLVISEKCNEVRNERGELIAPLAKEDDVFDYGVFDLQTMGL